MIFEPSYLTYELASQIGTNVAICKYSSEGFESLGGYAVVSEFMTFFVRIKLSDAGRPIVEVLDFRNNEIEGLFDYEPIVKGELSAVHQVIERGFSAERTTGLQFSFVSGEKVVIHQSDHVGHPTTISRNISLMDIRKSHSHSLRFTAIEKDLSWVSSL